MDGLSAQLQLPAFHTIHRLLEDCSLLSFMLVEHQELFQAFAHACKVCLLQIRPQLVPSCACLACLGSGLCRARASHNLPDSHQFFQSVMTFVGSVCAYHAVFELDPVLHFLTYICAQPSCTER